MRRNLSVITVISLIFLLLGCSSSGSSSGDDDSGVGDGLGMS
jgi:hypothetical protein